MTKDRPTDLERALAAGPPPDEEAAARAARRFADSAAKGSADVVFADLDSPVGQLIGSVTQRGLVSLDYVIEGDPRHSRDVRLQRLADRVSPRVVEARSALEPVARQLDEYFSGTRRHFDVPLDWRLTRGFGRRVLKATARIPYGQASTYTDVAARAGSPRAMRAAGNALGANPLPIIVPCHRVLRTGGSLGGYTGGLSRKEFLLALERD